MIRKLGGYSAYFTKDPQVNMGRDYNVTLADFPAWANNVMTLGRFKQIRAAYHPEVGASEIGDKCHQLRHAINSMNAASKSTFVPGPNLSFDEGGVASRSRMNPVRQYNKDKPQKFRVDFFVLCNNTPGCYFIVHLDVYQGKNAQNIGIPEEIQNLPTTQKAVVNAVIQSGIANDTDGLRSLFTDNRYSSPPLFVLLREKYGILCSGTTRKNRIGWPKDQMDMCKKTVIRGESEVLYDDVNKVLVVQWMDNRVVSLTSTLEVSGEVPVQRRSGSELLQLTVEKSLRQYQHYMDGVDRGDQYREMGGGFAKKSHYKKWYKKAYFAVLDFMVLNSFFAWNMSAENPDLARLKVKKWQYYAALAEEMIGYSDEEVDGEIIEEGTTRQGPGHVPTAMNAGTRYPCVVCNLEEGWRKKAGLKDAYGSSARSQKSMVRCASEDCQLVAHVGPVKCNRNIFTFPCFEGMNCFDIMHSEECKGLWQIGKHKGEMTIRTVKGNEGEEELLLPDWHQIKKQSYHVNWSHPLYWKLAISYGVTPGKRGGQAGSGSEEEEVLPEELADIMEENEVEEQAEEEVDIQEQKQDIQEQEQDIQEQEEEAREVDEGGEYV